MTCEKWHGAGNRRALRCKLGVVVRTLALNAVGFGVKVSGVKLWMSKREGAGSGRAESGSLAMPLVVVVVMEAFREALSLRYALFNGI